MDAKKAFNMFFEALAPIIQQDEDIIGCVKRNKFNEDEYKDFILWLINATICVMLGDTTDNDVAKELVGNCVHDMKVAEDHLTEAGYGNKVHDVLMEILQENIKEWLEIVNKQFEKIKNQGKKAKPAQKRASGKKGKKAAESEDSPAMAIFKLHTFFLKEVIMREDDALEFIEKYSDNVDKDVLSVYLTFNVFFAYLNKIKKGKIELPEDAPINKYLDELIHIATAFLQQLSEQYLAKNIEDGEQFNADVGEVLVDHFNEFIKKMWKGLFKQASKK